MSDKPPPREQLASEDVPVELDDAAENTVEQLEVSELGRTLESAADRPAESPDPDAPPPPEVIDAIEEFEPEDSDAPEDRPTIPRDAMHMADLSEELTVAIKTKSKAAVDDAPATGKANSKAPRPKSVRPPAPLPAPAAAKPLSRPPLPPPPPAPQADDAATEKRTAASPTDEEGQGEMADAESGGVGEDEPEAAVPATPVGTAGQTDGVTESDDQEAADTAKGADDGEAATAADGEDGDGGQQELPSAADEPAPGEAGAGDPGAPPPPRQTTPSIPDDDPVAEKGPPGIPSLAQPDSGQRKRSGTATKPRRDRKAKRRTVKIPDDNVPTVTTSGDEGEDDASTHAAAGDEPDRPSDDPATDAAAEDTTDTAATEESPLLEDKGDAPTSAEADRAQSGEGGSEKKEQTIFTDDQSIGVLRPIQVMSDLPPVEPIKPTGLPDAEVEATDAVHPTPSPTEAGPASTPPGTPPPKGAVQSSASPTSARRPPPPRRTDRPQEDEQLDGIEEVIPDRMSLPGLMPDLGGADDIQPNVTEAEPHARRPLPPPRGLMSSDPNLMVPSEPPAAQGAASAPGELAAFAPEDSSALTAAEAAARAAEKAAEEAEELARRAEQAAKDAEAKAEAARVAAEKQKKQPWWVLVFEDELVRTQDNPRKRDVEQETKFIEQSLRLERGSRVLDLACGPGVHAVELASRGYQMVGVDLSSTMLALANDYSAKRGTTVSFIQGDMRKLNLEDVFDGIYCWSSSFGYFDEAANLEVLKRVARALRTGGRFALDVTNRDFVAPRSPNMAWFEKPGCVCMDEMKFDFYTSRMITKRMVMFEEGRSTELEMSIRLYTLHELGKLLGKIGLKVIEVSGHRAHRTSYFGCESPRIIITSEKLPG
ncbi:MAG: hypothetical protein DRI90_14740 [Deltaproteobacteria bacterium]|nr:MAG: hypothetical protein DRI90_14740 [Deltaproteobacteria bacterium]